MGQQLQYWKEVILTQHPIKGNGLSTLKKKMA